jgi:hypothetical protein
MRCLSGAFDAPRRFSVEHRRFTADKQQFAWGLVLT